VLDFLRAYDRDRFSVEVCETNATPGDLGEVLGNLGVKRHQCRLGLNYFSFVKRFARLCRDGGYDVVHAHPMSFCGPMVHAARRAGVPVRIAHYWGTSEQHANDWKRRLYLYQIRRWVRTDSTHLAGCSRAVNELFFPDLTAGSDPRMVVFYPGVDLSIFRSDQDRAAVRRALGIPEDALVIGHVGRMFPMKNHAFLVDLLARIVPKLPAAKLLLVGGGPMRGQIESWVRQRGLADHVVFAGVTRHVAPWFSAMDVFVFCSHNEGFGIVVIQAEATGVPVVCVRVGGITEAVVDCCRPLQFDAGDLDAAEAAVLRVLSDGSLRQSLGAQARRQVERFSLSSTTAELMDFYENALRQRHRCAAGANTSEEFEVTRA
jgi:glycosyltransferase EpsF